MKITHVGWFGMCPVYLGNIYSDCPDVKARRPWLHRWFLFNIELQRVAIATCSFINPDWVPVWRIRVTGEVSGY